MYIDHINNTSYIDAQKYFLSISLLATLTSRIYYLMDDLESINFCTKVFK